MYFLLHAGNDRRNLFPTLALTRTSYVCVCRCFQKLITIIHLSSTAALIVEETQALIRILRHPPKYLRPSSQFKSCDAFCYASLLTGRDIKQMQIISAIKQDTSFNCQSGIVPGCGSLRMPELRVNIRCRLWQGISYHSETPFYFDLLYLHHSAVIFPNKYLIMTAFANLKELWRNTWIAEKHWI